jgi:hypothetical protein
MLAKEIPLRIRLVHWNRVEAEERAAQLRTMGHQVHAELPSPPQFIRELAAAPLHALVIDLTRLPSQGRDLAIIIRKAGATRHVPLVFVGGDPAKVTAVKNLLPDAVYTSWENIDQALKNAIDHPLQNPVAPRSVFEAYIQKSLPEKLGIRLNYAVGLVDAPDGFWEHLAKLTAGAKIHACAEASDDLILWFVRAKSELDGNINSKAALIDHNSLWILWPKKTSGASSDLSQQLVRETGLAVGLVDYKICSVDSVWSGLLFTKRKLKKETSGKRS